MPQFSLHRLFIAGLATLGLCTALNAQAEETVRIGYQKSSTLITLLKTQGTLEKALKADGIDVTWHEFPSGLPLLEALNVGNVDISADVADTVPIFAQAAQAKLTYFAQEAPSPQAQAIVVRKDSPIQQLADLKGKKIAVTKAAGTHYLLIAALNKAGLAFSDIEPAYLTPADGRAAFENNKVDAWVTWEPFLTSVQRQLPTRTLADGTGLASYKRYYLTGTPYAKAHPEVLKLVYEQLHQAGEWVKSHPRDAAKVLGPLWGNLDVETVEAANAHRSYEVQPVTLDQLGEQQKIADAFFKAGLLPKAVDAQDVQVWKP
ncbi:MAG: aliphatic sulfonate ABC transporter substrate-binding protein [Pseudomonas sp.]|jgi:sulfonate transport system substrate-binding protein|uniref:aliphatic sulfonate ABC transporter substrate-binding protein n=1 Tax=Pseudomonas sp. TaxID=306 RepID=UPI0023888391|nr:aliphatic sulfonate ABC transporter substrate-binding protein [Pseudomonas sp.]MDP9033145.1 aliphatic sulfonate ABC transporter substrate-binding protein [Pseudomonadota bacterium]MDE1913271.1 aliphatic sulfonate ABC transporter substrate-binding protein [Pseudomonas sp.]MDE2037312.1 aliphatic sulfonate ABC transporter substrate-binding protein [Pseudomonas sp.]MDE2193936.1 aliphatic sulfonate ABC transporter substrate-binding protein [Pseudomonas sp.]MDE2558081.1 aliphatic sulfonate ABC tr